MQLYLNANNNGVTFNKKEYLLRAASRLGLDWVKPYEGGQVENVLNIEPYGFVKGSNWTGVWEIDLLCDRGEMNPSTWMECDQRYVAITTVPKRMNVCDYKLLFQACDPVLHKRIGEPEFDFVMCGSVDEFHNERGRLISLLRDRFTFSDFPKGQVPEQYVKNISKARVQFIRSYGGLGMGEIAQRFFECLAIGPVLTDYCEDLKHTGLIEGVDYFSYKDDEEMLNKMGILISDEDFRNKMALNGRLKALMYHTYDHRLMTIINDICCQ